MAGGYADLMQQFGLADSMQAMYVKKQTDAAEAEINAGNYVRAFEVDQNTSPFYTNTCEIALFQIFDLLLNGDTIPYPSYFTNITGSTNYYNILRSAVSVISMY